MEYILYNRLLGLYKLWVLTAYTNDNILPDGTIINFSKIKYNEFVVLCATNNYFKLEIFKRVDSYFKHNIEYFIYYFVEKYNPETQISNNIIYIFKLEAYDILNEISISKTDIKKFIISLNGSIGRHNLGDLLKEQHIEI